MIVKAGFTAEMRDLLAAMKRKTFKSYECYREGIATLHAMGNLRINMGRSAIDLENTLQVLPFFDGEEEVACLSCKAVDRGEPFQPVLRATPKTYLIDEQIIEVEIVSDLIDVNHGEYMLDMDMAVIIHTKYGCYTFSRDIWFSDQITIGSGDPGQSLYPVQQVEQDWTDDPGEGSDTAEVTRTTRVL